ncbi:MAG: DsrE family protein [Methanofollis sp.]|uniref:DsrE family protein n=1 Tax=Methanofollis sp. TaxID=2052835 RepID=UPI0026099C14|nr:DsrE family protein [Methanofollis sp.]MDD4254424.1 DsrE family protein [Methanofollis sp.]
MVKTIRATGIKAPNASFLAANVITHLDTPGEEVRFVLSPGAEAGMGAVARKHGYALETTRSEKTVEVRMIPSGKTMEEIDVSGDFCPGPVITVGNILASLPVGERLKVKSTSADTIADVSAAVTSSGSVIVEQGVEGDRHVLIAEKAEKKAGAAAVVDRDSVLVAQSNGIGNAERAYATFIFSKVAASMGKKVTIFLLMDGVSMAKKGNAAGVRHPDFAPLDQVMAEVMHAGVTVYACELSAKFRGITEADLVPGVKLAGAATYINLLSDPRYAVVNF